MRMYASLGLSLTLALMAAGLPGNTPALLAEAVSQPGQRLTRSTVAMLAEILSCKSEWTSDAPVLIIYGALSENRIPRSTGHD